MPKEPIEKRLHQVEHEKVYLRDYLAEFVYGGIDGSITTFAVVSGAYGAGFGTEVVLILGFANLIADGFSMSVGSYLSAKSEIDNYKKFLKSEYWGVTHQPEEEMEEVREIYRKKGFEGSQLEEIVKVITSNKHIWVETMMNEELGIMKNTKPPLGSGIATFASFFVVGFIPLFSYVWSYFREIEEENMFIISCALTFAVFVVIGLLKSIVTHTGKWRGIFETLFLGAAAAFIAYFVGDFLKDIITG